MPIPLTCSCGTKLKARDDAAGKTVRCPSCRTPLQVPLPVNALPQSSPYKFPTSTRGDRHAPQPKFVIGIGKIVFIALAILIPAVILVAKFGPIRVQGELAKMYDPLDNAIHDVVNRTLQDRHKALGYKMDESWEIPQTTNVTFDKPSLPFRMPDHIHFQGTSTEGKYYGTYYLNTHKMTLQIDDGFNGQINVDATVNNGQGVVDHHTP